MSGPLVQWHLHSRGAFGGPCALKRVSTGIRGCIRGSVQLGGPMPVRGSVGPRAWGPLLYVSVCLHIHVAVCVLC